MAVALAGVGGAAWGQTVKYVDATATGENDGDSWTDAYTSLVTALENDAAGWEIRVAQGTYYPGTAVTDTFEIDTQDVEIYGGYAGLQGGQNPDARDIEDFETILSGIVANTPSPEFAYHVVTIDDAVGDTDGTGTPSTVLDGFTIKLGKATGGTPPADSGGGLLSKQGEAVISNCKFEDNEATTWGGGAYVRGDGVGEDKDDGDRMRFENCVFEDNEAGENGGGMLIEYARINVVDCQFISNEVTGTTITFDGEDGGGGVWISPGYDDGGISETRFVGCLFRNNLSHAVGGGLGVSTATHQGPQLINCVFYENVASNTGEEQGRGGGIWSLRTLYLTNCTFVKNECYEEDMGGGILLYHDDDDTYTEAELTNCILWNNKSASAHDDEADQIVVLPHPDCTGECTPAVPDVTHCCIRDLATWTGELLNNNSDNPEFYGINSLDLRMQGTGCNGQDCDSDSIDAGNNDAISEPYDFGKRTRKVNREGFGTIVDFGCLETQSGE
ncbi:MAG: hypothetical protein FLDDKLPJ_01925 [Phycisphaerae bacterium]|nr:hypothetical protein [Phycisphaerae bacterium]